MKTYFVFKTEGAHILVTRNGETTRSKVYAQFPAMVIGVLENIGFSQVGA